MKHTFMHTMSSCTYRFIPSSLIDLPEQRFVLVALLSSSYWCSCLLSSSSIRDYELVMRQEPQRAKMSVINERGK
jgi:hypothetical protein